MKKYSCSNCSYQSDLWSVKRHMLRKHKGCDTASINEASLTYDDNGVPNTVFIDEDGGHAPESVPTFAPAPAPPPAFAPTFAPAPTFAHAHAPPPAFAPTPIIAPALAPAPSTDFVKNMQLEEYLYHGKAEKRKSAHMYE